MQKKGDEVEDMASIDKVRFIYFSNYIFACSPNTYT